MTEIEISPDNINQENSQEEVEVPQQPKSQLELEIEKAKKRRGCYPGTNIKALWRYKPDGTYNNKACDPEYEKKYYHRKLKGCFICEKCTCEFASKKGMVWHQNHGYKCERVQALRAQL